MYQASHKYNKNSSTRDENPNTSSGQSESMMEDLKSRLAVRFLMKKTKRFDHLKQQVTEKQQQIQQIASANAEESPECLMYLGLAPKNMKRHQKAVRKLEPEFMFLKPQIYECGYCKKVFFHKLLFRRHMIFHMKKIHWCLKCNRGFDSKLSMRRHRLAFHP